MIRSLCPKTYLHTVAALTPDFLSSRGIKGIIFDLDNTILPWKAKKLTPDEILFIEQLKGHGFKMCIVSNALDRRVRSLLDPLCIPAISRARKPRRTPFRHAMEIMGTAPGETAVVGDQIFTDVFGGNRLGLYTILVTPVSRREFIGTKMIRFLEKRILKRMVKRGLIRKE